MRGQPIILHICLFPSDHLTYVTCPRGLRVKVNRLQGIVKGPTLPSLPPQVRVEIITSSQGQEGWGLCRVSCGQARGHSALDPSSSWLEIHPQILPWYLGSAAHSL